MGSVTARHMTLRISSVTVRIGLICSLAVASVVAIPAAASASAGHAAAPAGHAAAPARHAAAPARHAAAPARHAAAPARHAGRFSVETAYSADARSLAGISCPSAKDCVAVGEDRHGGGLIVATRNGGATWFREAAPLGVTDLHGLSC